MSDAATQQAIADLLSVLVTFNTCYQEFLNNANHLTPVVATAGSSTENPIDLTRSSSVTFDNQEFLNDANNLPPVVATAGSSIENPIDLTRSSSVPQINPLKRKNWAIKMPTGLHVTDLTGAVVLCHRCRLNPAVQYLHYCVVCQNF